MNKGLVYVIFECSGLRKLHAEKLKARQLDCLCDRFNVTAMRPRAGLILKVGNLTGSGR